MPWYFIITVILGILATIAGFLIPKMSDDTGYRDSTSPRTITRRVAIGLAGVTTALTLLSCVTITPANEVNIITNFGAWSGTRSSGISLTMPWSEADAFGTRNQRSIRDRADTPGSDNCVDVKLDGGSTGCQDLTVLYTIEEDNARKLWEGWKDFGKLNEDLIKRQTDDSVLAVFPTYKPLEAQGSKRDEITTKTTDQLRPRLASQGIRLESITLGTLHLPQETQNTLNALVDKDNKLQLAQKDLDQAKAEAQAQQQRQTGITPEGLVLKCLEAAREIKPQVMPSCGLGSAGEAGALVQVGPRPN